MSHIVASYYAMSGRYLYFEPPQQPLSDVILTGRQRDCLK